MNSRPIQYKYSTATDGIQPVRRVRVDGLFGYEVWRQRRDDLLREAEQSRMARAARAERKPLFAARLLNALSGVFRGRAYTANERNVVSKPEIRRIPGRDRRCGNRAA